MPCRGGPAGSPATPQAAGELPQPGQPDTEHGGAWRQQAGGKIPVGRFSQGFQFLVQLFIQNQGKSSFLWLS